MNIQQFLERFETLEAQNKALLGLLASQNQNNVPYGLAHQQYQMGQKHGDLSGPLPTAGVPVRERGFFRDLDLEACVVNAVLSPRNSIFNNLPVRTTMVERPKTATITSLDDTVVGALPDGPCDPGQPVSSDVGACKVAHPLNRYVRSSEIMEIDQLIKVAKRDECFDDFFFLGDFRGISGIPTANQIADDDFMRQSVVRFQMGLIGRAHQVWAINQIWTGDPANNTANNGYKEALGLQNLIVDDYPTNAVLAPFLEGSTDLTDCAALNADVKDFESACIGGVNPTSNLGIFAYMQYLEETLMHRADLRGLLPVQWVWVMRSGHWNELLRTLPCEMSGDGCSGAAVSDNLSITLNDSFNLQERERMRNAQAITVNGRTYPVWIDDSLPYTLPDANTQEADIYFLPTTIGGGEESLFIEHLDYTRINQVLQPINSEDLEGFTDGGRFHWTITRNRRCFELDAKSEWRLMVKGTGVSGRINNVRACRLQPLDEFTPPS